MDLSDTVPSIVAGRHVLGYFRNRPASHYDISGIFETDPLTTIHDF